MSKDRLPAYLDEEFIGPPERNGTTHATVKAKPAGLAQQTTAPRAAGRRFAPMPAYKPFPVDALPEPVSSYVTQAAKALHCDPAFLAIPALAVAAGLIGDSRQIRLRATWYEPCVVWTAVVSDSGTLKSPAFKMIVKYLWRIQKRLRDEHKAAMREWARDAKAAKENDKEIPDKPILQQAVVSDSTIEKLILILENNPRGIVLVRDELSGWIASFARYKGKGGGSDVPNWLEIHSAGAVSYERKTGENRSVFLARALASVCGTIQPRVMATALDNDDLIYSGLVARILMAMPPKQVKQWVELEIDPDTEAAFESTLTRLYKLLPDSEPLGETSPRTIRLSAEAKALFIDFYDKWAVEQRNSEGEMASCLAKLEAYAGRLALLHHAVSYAGLDMDDRHDLNAESMAAGITLARWFGHEAGRIYAALAEKSEDRDRRKLIETIQGRGGSITAKELQRSNQRKYPTADHARDDLERLAAVAIGHWEDRSAGPKGGRPTRVFYLDMACDQTDETFPDGVVGPDVAGSGV